MNESLTSKDCIEFFIKDGRFYALHGGVTSEVTPGSELYLTALKLAVTHKDYPQLTKRYGLGNDLVYGFIRDYLAGFNGQADVVDEQLSDCDGQTVIIINNHKVTPRERQVIRAASNGLCDKQVASLLGNSVFTVNAMFKSLRFKWGATSKYHVIAMAAKAGVI